jgi:hypothetical protein
MSAVGDPMRSEALVRCGESGPRVTLGFVWGHPQRL